MKYLMVIILSISFSFSQSANGNGPNLIMNVSTANSSIVSNFLKIDLNADGNSETLQGERIIKLNENEIWVKNTELTSINGDRYYFGNKLKRNNVNLTNQVTSEYGYILVYEENKVIAYIAGKEGYKDSDAILISLSSVSE